MSEFKRLPRKLKKQIKKNPEKWIEYKEKKMEAKERHESLDLIFTRNYRHSRNIIRRMIRIGK